MFINELWDFTQKEIVKKHDNIFSETNFGAMSHKVGFYEATHVGYFGADFNQAAKSGKSEANV